MSKLGTVIDPRRVRVEALVGEAMSIAASGWPVFPCRPNKQPYTYNGFKSATTDAARVRAMFAAHDDALIGLAVGTNAGVWVLDVDPRSGGDERLAELIAEHGPLPDTVEASTMSGGRHYYFRAPDDEPMTNRKGRLGKGLDVRGDGGYVVVPPSRGYGWTRAPQWYASPVESVGLDDDDIVKSDFADAPDWMIGLIRDKAGDADREPPREPRPWQRQTARPASSSGGSDFFRTVNDKALANLGAWVPSLFPAARYQPGTGAYRVSSRQLGRTLEEDLSLSPEGIVDFGVHDIGDPNEGKRTPIDIVMEHGGAPDAVEAARWLCDRLGIDPSSIWPHSDPPPVVIALVPRETAEGATDTIETEPEPSFFDPFEGYSVPFFPIDALPPVVADFVSVTARQVGSDPAALAWSALVAASGAIDHRIRLKMTEHGSWSATPRLWVMLVGDPSARKTPAIGAAMRPLQAIEDRRRADHLDELGRCITKEDQKALPRPERLIATDSTIEALQEILKRQTRGILIKRDELSGWIGSMEKYSGGGGSSADRAFWLQAYDGGSYSIDRIGRGEGFLPNLSVSLIGGIQPARLREIGDLSSDGLLQRFVPVMMQPPTFPEDCAAGNAARAYDGMIQGLVGSAPDWAMNGARPVSCSSEAMAVLVDARRRLFDLGRDATGGLQGFVGKLEGLVGSLTLILHMIAHGPGGAAQGVRRDTAEQAWRLIEDFVIPHAIAFYDQCAGGAIGEKVAKTASYILTAEGKDRFVASDFTTNVRHLRGLNAFDLNKEIGVFVTGGWLTPAEAGPAPRAWTVHPQLRDFLARRTAEETRRKAALLSYFEGMRQGKRR